MTLEDVLVFFEGTIQKFPREAAENSENTPNHSTYPPGWESNQ